MKNLTLTLTDETGKTIHKAACDTRDASDPFKSGKTGFGTYGKVEANGERFQLSFNLVKIAAK